MKKMITSAVLAGILAAYSAHAANGHSLEITCKDPKVKPPAVSGFWIDVDSNDEVSTSDGGELGATYSADHSKDSATYADFKIVPRDQDGEQPAELKIAKVLLAGAGKTGGAWLAPGIVGGQFTCTSKNSEE